jgi:catechol-2,3-dioxygenase
MIKARRFGYATFETADIDADVAYYEDVIGLQAAVRSRDRAFLVTETGQLAVVLEAGRSPQCTGLAFEVAPDMSLAEAARGLSARGIASEGRSDPVPGVAEALTFRDPKGTRIQLFSRWDFLPSARAVDGLRPNKLGHLAFVVPDPETMARFYMETLGFRFSDRIEDWFVFLRCCADHHTVNFIRGPASRIHHVAFELRDSSHLNRGCDLLARHDIPIIWGPLRQGPGHNIAVYHRNSAGHIVELFIDMDEMVDDELGYYEPRPWHRDRPQRPKVWRETPRIWGFPPSPEFTREVE